MIDVAGFNQFQQEILVIDTKLNGLLEASDVFIAIALPPLRKGAKVPFDHPRFIELRRQYLETKAPNGAAPSKP